MESTTLNQS